jgi:hypothetical protein
MTRTVARGMGDAGSDDSGSVLDLFAVTACARQPACPPRPKRPTRQYPAGRPKGAFLRIAENLRLTGQGYGPDSVAAASASLASTFLLGPAESSSAWRHVDGWILSRSLVPIQSGGGWHFIGTCLRRVAVLGGTAPPRASIDSCCNQSR